MADEAGAAQTTEPQEKKSVSLFSKWGIILLLVCAMLFVAVGLWAGKTIFQGRPTREPGEVDRCSIGYYVKLDPFLVTKTVHLGTRKRRQKVSLRMQLEAGPGPDDSVSSNLYFLENKAKPRLQSEVFKMVDELSYEEIADAKFYSLFPARVKKRLNKIFGEDTIKEVLITKKDF